MRRGERKTTCSRLWEARRENSFLIASLANQERLSWFSSPTSLVCAFISCPHIEKFFVIRCYFPSIKLWFCLQLEPRKPHANMFLIKFRKPQENFLASSEIDKFSPGVKFHRCKIVCVWKFRIIIKFFSVRSERSVNSIYYQQLAYNGASPPLNLAKEKKNLSSLQ